MIRLPLETERLRIRPFEPERDAAPLHELWGNAQAMPTEAGGPLLTAAWGAGLDWVVAVAMPENVASRRVMEKLGMKLDGPTRYRELDVVRYSITRPRPD